MSELVIVLCLLVLIVAVALAGLLIVLIRLLRSPSPSPPPLAPPPARWAAPPHAMPAYGPPAPQQRSGVPRINAYGELEE